MKKTALVFLFILLLPACSGKDKEQNGDFIARVGDVRITQADYDREFRALPAYAQEMFKDAGGRERFLDEIIKKELLYQEAVKKGLDKTPEFKRKIEDYRKISLISDLFEKEVTSKAMVSDQEVRDFYEKNKGEFTTISQIRARHILVKTIDEAEKVLARLKKGEKFEDLAKAVSIDKASAAKGGDLGYFSKGEMVPEFENAAMGLEIGEISRPVKTPFGYHIIKAIDKKAGPAVEFESVKAMIMQKLLGDKQKEIFDKYIAGLKKSYRIEIRNDLPADTPENLDGAGSPDADATAGQPANVQGEEDKKAE
ncbi:MAG: peptidylprolyl isomerase [Nitrospirota bacterium]|nr:peptidylprolyl isomerase [Nitrospirota bacterium]